MSFLQFKPLVQEENKHNIHHIVLYECIVPKTAAPDGLGTAGILDKFAEKPSVRCNVPSTPPEWGHCNHILVMWTSGSEGICTLTIQEPKMLSSDSFSYS